MISEAKRIEWGRRETLARQADDTAVKDGVMSLKESQRRSQARFSCSGMTVPEARAALIDEGKLEKHTIEMRALMFPECARGQTAWVAICLEKDIAAQATTETTLREELARVLLAHIAVSEHLGRIPFDGMQPAPKRFWDAWDNAAVTESVDVPGLNPVCSESVQVRLLPAAPIYNVIGT